MLISERRLQKVVVILKAATILAFHHALVKRKHNKRYSNQKSQEKSGVLHNRPAI